MRSGTHYQRLYANFCAKQVVIDIEGMMCDGCVKRVSQTLTKVGIVLERSSCVFPPAELGLLDGRSAVSSRWTWT